MNKRTNWTGIGVLVLALSMVVLLGQPVQASKKDNTIVFGQSISITDLGPAFGAFLNYPAGYEAGFVLYDRLVTFDQNLTFNPQLATSWDIADDQKSVTFKLRRGVKFHDGTDFDAAAVKFNIERMIEPERNTTNRPLWSPLAGADVIDAYTVRIRTTEPFALILNTLAHGSGAMVSPTAIAKNGDKSMSLNPVGAGPYMLESFKPGQELVLKAFDGYWGGRPKIDKIIFNYIPEASTRISALRTGSVDVIDQVPVHLISAIREDAALQIITKPGLRPMGLAILTARAPYDDLRVRQALNHAVPVKAIAEKIFFGYAKESDSPLAFNTFGYARAGSYGYDVKKAKALLAEAGWRDTNGDGIVDKNGKPFTMNLLTPEGSFPGDIHVTEIAANAFKAIGIDVTISKVEKGSYWDALRVKVADAKWDLAQFGFNPSNGAGSYHLNSMFHSNTDDAERPVAWNIVRFNNKQFDVLVEKAQVTVDPDKRKVLLAQAQKIVWDQAPYVWMHVPEIVSAANKDLQGVEVWPIIFTILRNAHY